MGIKNGMDQIITPIVIHFDASIMCDESETGTALYKLFF